MSGIVTSERLVQMDAVRGFALCGILFANLMAFSGIVYLSPAELQQLSGLNRSILFSIDFLIEGKFYSLFSILFGMGSALIWQKTECIDKSYTAIWLRRMSFLLLVGLFHLLIIWHGDILTLYALLGFSLPVFMKMQKKSLTNLILVLLLLPLVIYGIRYQTQSSGFWSLASAWAMEQRKDYGYASHSIPALLAANDALVVLHNNLLNALQRPMSYLQTGRLFQVLAQFLIGIWLVRFAFDAWQQHKLFSRSCLLLLSIFAILLNVIYAGIKYKTGLAFSLTPLGAIQSLVYHLGSTSFALVYFVLIAKLATQNENRLINLFSRLGRMPLSLYLMQSLIGIGIFYGYGLGLIGQLRAAFIPAIACTIIFLQYQFAIFYLAHFNQGPLETLWRRWVYGK